MDTIEQIVDWGLCTGCGTCAGICPHEAVKMQNSKGLMLPKIQVEKCDKCGVCVKSCPGHQVDFEELNSEIFEKQPTDVKIGNFLTCYVGHAKDNNVRYHSSSGGVATRLLIFALEKGIIDGALVVRMNDDRPLEPQPFIAQTKEEILSASKSKYCPVPMNEGLRQILKKEGRFAVVGLPCHIHGIRKAERIFRVLEKKIVLRIGLMCSHTVNFFGTEFLLEKMHIRNGQEIKLNYRGMGWPGSMSIQLRNGSSLALPYVGSWNAYWPIFSSFFYTPMRCIMCPDQTNELAGISLGDAWLPELKHERYGKSIIITRTKAAEDILTLANSEGIIFMKNIGSEKVKQSQAEPLKFKKDDLGLRFSMLKSLGRKVPVFRPKPNSSSSFSCFFRTVFSHFNMEASSSKHLRSLLIHVPFPLFRLYYGVFKFISLI